MSLQNHHIWGRPVIDYFSSDPDSAFFPNGKQVPSSEHVKTVSIPRLQANLEPSHDTISDYTSILSLLYHPNELRHLGNTMLLARCMNVMRNFTDQLDPSGQKLFNYELGFLCFRVTVLLIQVCILIHTGTFDTFARQTRNMTNPHYVSAALAIFVFELMRDPSNKKDRRNWLLGTHTSQTGERMFLRTVGGVFDVDISLFLGAIWRDRKTFFQICVRVPTPGWFFALFAIEEHMQWALEIGIEDEAEWSLIQMLCFRYSLVAPSDELDYLSTTCVKIDAFRQESSDTYFTLSSADMDDARTVLQAYIARMTPSPAHDRFPPDFDDLLIEFIGQDTVLDQVDLMPQLLSISLSRIWEQLELGTQAAEDLTNNSTLVRHATFTFDIAKRLYENSGRMPTRIISSFTEALSEADFLNLAGRFMLIPTANGSKAPELDQDARSDARSDDSFVSYNPWSATQNWIRLTESIISFSEVYAERAQETNGSLVKFYPDWVKTWNNFMLQFPQHSDPSPWMKSYIESCQMTWMVLGFAFGYGVEEELNRRGCAYNRCFGPVRTGYADRTCERCLVASYCGVRCQNADWKTTAIESHQDFCLEFSGLLS